MYLSLTYRVIKVYRDLLDKLDHAVRGLVSSDVAFYL